MCELDRYSSRENHQSSDLEIMRSVRVARSSWWLSQAARHLHYTGFLTTGHAQITFAPKLLSLGTSHLYGGKRFGVAVMFHWREHLHTAGL